MERFRGIEGARGWLALIVLVAHLVTASGFGAVFPAAEVLGPISGSAVNVFIIISGFVIAHLQLSRKESYPLYLMRRWLRIYPVYLVCLLLGIAVEFLTKDTASAIPWLNADVAGHLASQSRELENGNFPFHLLAHLTLLHGAISNNLLDETQFMFLGPSWSLSLEWQFYLIAPVVIAAFQRRGWNLVLLTAVALGHLTFIQGIWGIYYTPSVLPAAGVFFAIGILSRLYFDRLPKLRSVPVSVVLGLVALAVFLLQTAYLVGWAIVIAYLLLQPEALEAGSRRPLTRLLQLALDSRPARALGQRSYAIYLLHQPVIGTVTVVGTTGLHLGPVPLFLFTSAVSIVLVAAGAELIHRWVELPAIAYGRRLGTERKPLTPSEPATEERRNTA